MQETTWSDPIGGTNEDQVLRVPGLKDSLSFRALASSPEPELAEVSINPMDSHKLELAIRSHSSKSSPLDVTTTVHASDPQQKQLLIEYSKDKPLLIAVVTSPETVNTHDALEHDYQQLLG